MFTSSTGGIGQRRPMYGVVLALILIVAYGASLSFAQSETVSTHRSKVISPGGYSQLFSKFQEGGPVKVIVRLTMPLSAEARREHGEIEDRRAPIGVVQEQVLADLELRGLGPIQAYRYKYSPSMAMTVERASFEALLELPSVMAVEEDVFFSLALDLTVPRIGARELHIKGITGKDFVVAILDTGVDKTHPFLQGSVVSEACYSSNSGGTSSLCPGRNEESTAAGSGMPCGGNWVSEDCSHGTHVAGIVAGRMGIPGSPGPGVAPDAGIIAIQVFSQSGSSLGAWNSDIKKGLERVYELRGLYQIASVNMSLGEGAYAANCDGYSLKDSIDLLRDAGIATVIASGNNGYCGAISAPACISSAISVGATDDGDGVAEFSNRASFMTIFAPGSSIESSVPGSSYAVWNGTSMAAPHVAGSWALMKQAYPAGSVEDILHAFSSTGPSIAIGTCAPGMTKKRIDVDEAHSLLSSYASLTVFKTGLGAGTIVSSPEGIYCGEDCGELFPKGSTVTLSALPEAGTVFGGWTGGGCSGTGPCSIMLEQRTSVAALFIKEATIGLTLTIRGVGFGTRKGTVLVGNTPARILKKGWSDNIISFTLMRVPEGSPDIFPVTVIPKSKGAPPLPPVDHALVVREPIIDNPEYHVVQRVPVTITGRFFGTLRPRVYIQYTSKTGFLKKKRRKVISWFMDPSDGGSSVTFRAPVLPKGSRPGPYLLEIRNKVGAARTYITF